MKKYILNPAESKDHIKEYINNMDDVAYEIETLTWEIQPTQLQLLNEAGSKMSEAIELLKQVLNTPERFEVKYES